MANKRKEIRQKIKELLSLDSNFTDVTIFSSRQTAIVHNQQLPSITVFVANEPVIPADMSKERYIRSPEITFEARTEETSNVDDILDDLMSKIENFMTTNRSVEGLLLDSVLQNSESDIGIEGTKEIGLGTVVYEGQYIN